MPKFEKKRIIAIDLPPRTISPNSFDFPKRKDVIQVEIPTSTTKIVTWEKDPLNFMRPLDSLKVAPGMKSVKTVSFLQIDPAAAQKHYDEAINTSSLAEARANTLLSKVSVNNHIMTE